MGMERVLLMAWWQTMRSLQELSIEICSPFLEVGMKEGEESGSPGRSTFSRKYVAEIIAQEETGNPWMGVVSKVIFDEAGIGCEKKPLLADT